MSQVILQLRANWIWQYSGHILVLYSICSDFQIRHSCSRSGIIKYEPKPAKKLDEEISTFLPSLKERPKQPIPTSSK